VAKVGGALSVIARKADFIKVDHRIKMPREDRKHKE
jgi:hypothetical protein